MEQLEEEKRLNAAILESREGEGMNHGKSEIITNQTAVTVLEESERLFFTDVAGILQAGRATTYRAVNAAMVETYWRMGRRIVEEEQQGKTRAGYGEALMIKLSRYLGENFGKGFSVANLWNFRQFYLTFPSLDEFSTHRVGNLGWTHIRLIMRLENKDEQLVREGNGTAELDFTGTGEERQKRLLPPPVIRAR